MSFANSNINKYNAGICTPHVHSNIIHISQKVKATQMSVNREVGKQN